MSQEMMMPPMALLSSRTLDAIQQQSATVYSELQLSELDAQTQQCVREEAFEGLVKPARVAACSAKLWQAWPQEIAKELIISTDRLDDPFHHPVTQLILPPSAPTIEPYAKGTLAFYDAHNPVRTQSCWQVKLDFFRDFSSRPRRSMTCCNGLVDGDGEEMDWLDALLPRCWQGTQPPFTLRCSYDVLLERITGLTFDGYETFQGVDRAALVQEYRLAAEAVQQVLYNKHSLHTLHSEAHLSLLHRLEEDYGETEAEQIRSVQEAKESPSGAKRQRTAQRVVELEQFDGHSGSIVRPVRA